MIGSVLVTRLVMVFWYRWACVAARIWPYDSRIGIVYDVAHDIMNALSALGKLSRRSSLVFPSSTIRVERESTKIGQLPKSTELMHNLEIKRTL